MEEDKRCFSCTHFQQIKGSHIWGKCTAPSGTPDLDQERNTATRQKNTKASRLSVKTASTSKRRKLEVKVLSPDYALSLPRITSQITKEDLTKLQISYFSADHSLKRNGRQEKMACK